MSDGSQGWQGPPGAPGGWQGPAGGPPTALGPPGQGQWQGPPGAPGGQAPWQGPPGAPGGWHGGPGAPGGWQPQKPSPFKNPAVLIPLVLLLVVAVGGGVFLLTRSGDDDVALSDSGEMADVAEAMAAAPPAEDTEAAAAPPEAMVESMVQAMADPAPEAAQTEAVRPEPLGAMPDAPPEPAPFDPASTPVPEQMTDGGGDLAAIRSQARPVTPFEVVDIPIGGEDAAVISFTLQAGDLISVSASGDQDPDLFLFGPDDAPVASDFDSGPGLDALGSVVAEVSGEYLAAAVNNTGQAGTITMTLQDFAEFQILDVPDGSLAAGDFVSYSVDGVAGDVLHVLIATDFVPTLGIARNGEVLAVGSEVAPGLHLVELAVQADGVYDVLVLAEQTGGPFFLYATVQIG